MKNLINKIFNFIVNIPKDKLLHYIACYVISHTIISIIFAIFHPSYGGCVIGFCSGVVIAMCKEIYDSKHEDHSSEFLDFIYGCLGSLTASILMLISIL